MGTEYQTQGQTPKILVAEDCRDTQFILEYTLRNIEADIHFVGNGADCVVEALSAAKAKAPFDLILMDIQMPVLDGHQATRKLREQGYDKKIVAFTTHSTKRDEEASLAAGCDGHMSKLMKKHKIIDGIQGWLQEEKEEPSPVSLPALPVVPEFLKNEPRYAERALTIIDTLARQRELLIHAVKNEDWHCIKQISLELSTLELFGYGAFTQSLEKFEDALRERSAIELQQALKQVLHCLDGIRAGRSKVSELVRQVHSVQAVVS